MERATTSELKVTKPIDGGRCSSTKTISSSMCMERLWMFKDQLMQKAEISRWCKRQEKLTSNGILSMQTHGQKSQRKESSTKNSVFMYREISTLFLIYHNIDTLRLSTIETWLSRLQMEIEVKSGTSINNQRPSRQDWTTNLGISRALEEPVRCKSGALTLVGGKYSHTKEDSSQTIGTTES